MGDNSLVTVANILEISVNTARKLALNAGLKKYCNTVKPKLSPEQIDHRLNFSNHMISKIDPETPHLIDGKIVFWSDESHVHLAPNSAAGLKTWSFSRPNPIELGEKNGACINVSGIVAVGHKLPLIYLEEDVLRRNGLPFVNFGGTHRKKNLTVDTSVHINYTLTTFLNYAKTNGLWEDIGEGRGRLINCLWQLAYGKFCIYYNFKFFCSLSEIPEMDR